MTQFDLTKYLAEGRLHEGNTNTTTSEVEFEGETYRIELRRDGNYIDYDIFDAEGNDTIRGDRDREEAFMDAFDAQHPDAAGIYAESKLGEAKQQIRETLDEDVWDMVDRMLDAMGADEFSKALVKAMSTDDAKLYLSAIMSDHDIQESTNESTPGDDGIASLSEELGPKGESTTFSLDYRGEPYTIEWYKQDQGYAKDKGKRSVHTYHQVYTPEGDVVDWDAETYEEALDMFASQYPEFTGSDLAEPSIEENIKGIKTNKMKKSELKEIIKSALVSELDGAKNVTQTTEDVSEAEEVDVEDNEDIDVDIEKDVTIDDESTEADIDVKASVSGESEDVEAVQGLLTKALEQAKAMGDEKLTDQIGNTITYFTRAHISNVSEADLDMELDPTDVTKINPEAAAVIGLDEGKSKRRNESMFPIWNKIK